MNTLAPFAPALARMRLTPVIVASASSTGRSTLRSTSSGVDPV